MFKTNYPVVSSPALAFPAFFSSFAAFLRLVYKRNPMPCRRILGLLVIDAGGAPFLHG